MRVVVHYEARAHHTLNEDKSNKRQKKRQTKEEENEMLHIRWDDSARKATDWIELELL